MKHGQKNIKMFIESVLRKGKYGFGEDKKYVDIVLAINHY